MFVQRHTSNILYCPNNEIIYQFRYKGLVESGNMTACLSIAERSGYPPALIAKMVLSSYMAESRQNKPKTDAKKAIQLRKLLCPYCVDRKKSISEKDTEDDSRDEESTIKKHNDPRIELALNLFDEDDEIGKYFLEKFKYSRDSKPATKNKSNKFYWQASSFEQMGEKNVMQCKNIERLFANPNPSNSNPKVFSEEAKIINGSNSDLMKRVLSSSRDTEVERSPSKNVSSSNPKRRTSFRIKDLLNDFDGLRMEDDSEKSNNSVDNDSFPEYPPSPDNSYRCTCKSYSSSDDSDSDDDSEETC